MISNTSKPSSPIHFGTVYKLPKRAYSSAQSAQTAVISRYPQEDTPDIFTFCSEPPEHVSNRRQAYYVCTKEDGKLARVADRADQAGAYVEEAVSADTLAEARNLLKFAKEELPSSVTLEGAEAFALHCFEKLMGKSVSF